VISRESFTMVLQGLQALRPFGKPLPEAALLLAWSSFPDQAKAELDDEDLEWAASQAVLDPDPPAKLAPHVSLLRYIYATIDGSALPENGRRRGSEARPSGWLPFPRSEAEGALPAPFPGRSAAAALPAASPAADGDPLGWADLSPRGRHNRIPLPDLQALQLIGRGQGIGAELARGIAAGRWSLAALDQEPGWWNQRPPGSPPWRNLAREWIQGHPDEWAAMQARCRAVLSRATAGAVSNPRGPDA
jgi:hypothetical protein